MSGDSLVNKAASTALSDWMAGCQAHFEQVAARQLPAAELEPRRLHQAMRYAVLGGGKRVRPLLLYAAAELAQAPQALADAAALAVEYVHAYSLIHDDLPCMDNDVLRRGRPTVHVAFDEATAMLAGDALQAEAFVVLAESGADPAVKAQWLMQLAQAAGTRGICGGQAIDLASVGRRLSIDELETMHRMKTGALLAAAVKMGAAAGTLAADEGAALGRYAAAIGLAFQVVDDLLDVEQDSQTLGKTAGKDAAADKPTYVSALGVAGARDWAGRLHREAQEAIAGFGARAARLAQLADFIVLRTS
jgi:farnesyl diphosphate synthase